MRELLCSNDHELMSRIITTVAGVWGVAPDDLMKKSSDSVTREARQVAMYLGCHSTGMTTTEVGRSMGGLDHAVVINVRERVRERVMTDKVFQDRIRILAELLGSLKREPVEVGRSI